MHSSTIQSSRLSTPPQQIAPTEALFHQSLSQNQSLHWKQDWPYIGDTAKPMRHRHAHNRPEVPDGRPSGRFVTGRKETQRARKMSVVTANRVSEVEKHGVARERRDVEGGSSFVRDQPRHQSDPKS